jgi:glucose-6-phosphate isomerase|tara:strand:- start:3553 stop:4716 length:1164 start_codon:yes stop_codon:yes gene_type:complete
MLTSNIKFKNFNISKFKNLKNLKNFKNEKWFKKIRLFESLKLNYKYSYTKEQIKKINKNKNFRLIGMGGSTLGVEAIYQFLNHKIKKKFIFINNLNSKLNNYEKKIKATNIIISKSGNTLETIVNSNALVNGSKNIFITENKKNYLRNLANDLKAEIVEHKNYIGGRYSVLSEVGMLPAEIMGLDEKKFKRLNYLINNKNFLNELIKNVSAILKFVKEKKFNSIILNYDNKSENLFKWYQQLVAESLGKKSKGILPIISTMPSDNHSLLQLYLDGPKNNFFTFFSTQDTKSDKINNKFLQKTHNYLRNKSFSKIIYAQKSATEKVFYKKKLPFRSFEVKKRNEEVLGELFCFFILETILLGRALKVNPFDQPSVELIKKETKKILFN